MAVEGVHKEYIQKSRLFLYPLLNIKRGQSIKYENTFISWEKMLCPEDKKLIVVYKRNLSPGFRHFEKFTLKGHKLFYKNYLLNGGRAAYIFNMHAFSEEWNSFLRGKYSLFTEEAKERIKGYFYINNLPTREGDLKVIDSFLNPPSYYRDYRNIFLVDEEHFMHSGELCSKPDFIKEELTEQPLNLDINLQLS